MRANATIFSLLCIFMQVACGYGAAKLFAYGDGRKVNYRLSSSARTVGPFTFTTGPVYLMSQTFASMYVDAVGTITAGTTSSNFFTTGVLPVRSVRYKIMPLWSDFGNDMGNGMYAEGRLSTSADELQRASEIINSCGDISGFAAKEILIGTWSRVIHYLYTGTFDKLLTNTFQCVIAKDGFKTAAIFLYEDINFKTATYPTVMVGYQLTDTSFCQHPLARNVDLTKLPFRTNAKTAGVWVVPLTANMAATTRMCFPRDQIVSFHPDEDIDECAKLETNPCPAYSSCFNQIGPFPVCTCHSGFIYVNKICEDVNECAGGNNCSGVAKCTNTLGSYNCSCKSGYTGDGVVCNNTNECLYPSSCPSNTSSCVDTEGSYMCVCKAGYKLVGNSCVDINECAGDNECSEDANCTNTIGSYTCKCDIGYTGDGINCNNINECMHPKSCPSNTSSCVDTEGSYMCVCKDGYELIGTACVDIDECGTNTSVCDNTTSTCRDTEGSYACDCKVGYTVDSSKVCVDVNECAGVNECSKVAKCINTMGSYTCACKSGYTGDGFSCNDVNECDRPNRCDNRTSYCANTNGSYACECKPGFEMNDDKCEDIRECEDSPDICGAGTTCNETEGSYACVCLPGYANYRSGVGCMDVNECDRPNRCDNRTSYCTNTNGSYACECKSGFEMNGDQCEDIRECEDTPNICGTGAACNELEGTYMCSCLPGFENYRRGMGCSDIRECEDMPDICGTGAHCNETKGSYICTCIAGYENYRSGVGCIDVNECDRSNRCDNRTSYCTNTNGSYACECKPGFEMSGDRCEDIQECEETPDLCGPGAACNETEGSYICTCLDGYENYHRGVGCVDINECVKFRNPCGQHATCNNTDGSVVCACYSGFESLSGYGISKINCTDIDECKEKPCDTNADCFNRDGSYSCQCKSGYSGDGQECSEINECLLRPCHTNATCKDLIGSFACACMRGYVGDGFNCSAIRVFAESGSFTSNAISENEIRLRDDDSLAASTLIVSVVSGVSPGAVLQSSPLINGLTSLMYFTGGDDTAPVRYDWLAIDQSAENNEQFQFGKTRVEYNVESKCFAVEFTTKMRAEPKVTLSLLALHDLDPFFLGYSLIWLTSVSVDGFEACVHEGVLFSGDHFVEVSYVAVAYETADFGQLSEKFSLDFARQNFSVGDGDFGYRVFCKNLVFSRRYMVAPPVFVTSYMNNTSEQITWIRNVTRNYVTICSKNSEDSDTERTVAAKVDVIVAGANAYHVCNGVDVPRHLACYEANTSPGYIFDCWNVEDCPDEMGKEVCASDFGTYESECKMLAETCHMYGKEIAKNITWKTGKCNSSLDPYVTASAKLSETAGPNVMCGSLSFNGSHFHPYSPVLVVLTQTLPEKATASVGSLTGLTSWTENDGKTLKACAKIMDPSYDAQKHGRVVVYALAYQKNLHRRRKGLGGDTFQLPTWLKGTKCFNIRPTWPVNQETSVLLSLASSSANVNTIATWTEASDGYSFAFRLCARNTDLFSVKIADLKLNWIAMPRLRGNRVEFSSIDVAKASGRALCKNADINGFVSTLVEVPGTAVWQSKPINGAVIAWLEAVNRSPQGNVCLQTTANVDEFKNYVVTIIPYESRVIGA